MAVIPVLRSFRQEDPKFEASLGWFFELFLRKPKTKTNKTTTKNPQMSEPPSFSVGLG
jgi:hypothetical protein